MPWAGMAQVWCGGTRSPQHHSPGLSTDFRQSPGAVYIRGLPTGPPSPLQGPAAAETRLAVLQLPALLPEFGAHRGPHWLLVCFPCRRLRAVSAPVAATQHFSCVRSHPYLDSICQDAPMLPGVRATSVRPGRVPRQHSLRGEVRPGSGAGSWPRCRLSGAGTSQLGTLAVGDAARIQ